MVAKNTRKKKSNETIKKELLDSLKENDNLEELDLDATIDAITDPIDSVRFIKLYEEIIKIQKSDRLYWEAGAAFKKVQRNRTVS